MTIQHGGWKGILSLILTGLAILVVYILLLASIVGDLTGLTMLFGAAIGLLIGQFWVCNRKRR